MYHYPYSCDKIMMDILFIWYITQLRKDLRTNVMLTFLLFPLVWDFVKLGMQILLVITLVKVDCQTIWIVFQPLRNLDESFSRNTAPKRKKFSEGSKLCNKTNFFIENARLRRLHSDVFRCRIQCIHNSAKPRCVSVFSICSRTLLRSSRVVWFLSTTPGRHEWQSWKSIPLELWSGEIHRITERCVATARFGSSSCIARSPSVIAPTHSSISRKTAKLERTVDDYMYDEMNYALIHRFPSFDIDHHDVPDAYISMQPYSFE